MVGTHRHLPQSQSNFHHSIDSLRSTLRALVQSTDPRVLWSTQVYTGSRRGSLHDGRQTGASFPRPEPSLLRAHESSPEKHDTTLDESHRDSFPPLSSRHPLLSVLIITVIEEAVSRGQHGGCSLHEMDQRTSQCRQRARRSNRATQGMFLSWCLQDPSSPRGGSENSPSANPAPPAALGASLFLSRYGCSSGPRFFGYRTMEFISRVNSVVHHRRRETEYSVDSA